MENKDTFFSLKKCLSTRLRTIAGVPFNFLIYGEGRKIVTGFEFYREVQGLQGEAPIKAYYFGDLDPEGIDIWGQLQENFPEVQIEPFTYLYTELLRLYPDRPRAREKNQKLKPERLERFLSYFPPRAVAEIKSLLAYFFLDALRNGGRPFSYLFQDLETGQEELYKFALIDTADYQVQGKMKYKLSEIGLDLLFKTKEIYSELRISISQLYLRQQIEKGARIIRGFSSI